ncbi:PucR family transcriptional regulator [Mycolicibacterium septicum DSM 44393]|uniref:PucR family transcriptional regulator n=1 Tax=Mycolicibacterium septicum DSM 44393 TaxID=1341646 RepID=A0A7X6MLQ0_9MYCO|nr:PucR family transcriptional regulator [Mycolicibacterium septicum DSM 44393]
MTLSNDPQAAAGQSLRLRLPPSLLRAVRDGLPLLSQHTIARVLTEVPAYADAVGAQRRLIENAVDQTITVFIELVAEGKDPDTSPAQDPALDGGYSLGRAEARASRSPEMLLAAYRVGARTVWRQWSSLAVTHDLPGDQLAVFAELIFAYMDRLSAAAVSGHADELAKTGLARQRARELLTRRLISSASAEELLVSAERADWSPPRTLTAVAVRSGRAVVTAMMIDRRTLEVPDDAVGPIERPMSLVLVPDVGGSAREEFLSSFSIEGSVVGPARPWMQAGQSVRRVARALVMNLDAGPVTDTERLLTELVLGADSEALADLRSQTLAPLSELRPVVRDNLIVTLRSWLLHHGRRDDIAAELFVHPGTVRYRLGQLRELYGGRLNDPRTILELTVALGVEPTQSRQTLSVSASDERIDGPGGGQADR